MALKDKDARAAYNRAYREAHAEAVKAKQAAWREAHREEINAKARAYEQHPERKAHREGYARQWLEKNRERHNHNTYHRRALKRGASGKHTAAQWEALKAAYDFMCLRCRRREPEITLTRDHVVPVSRGGGDGIDNIQPLCHECNSRKHAHHLDYRQEHVPRAEYEELIRQSASRWPIAARSKLGAKKRKWHAPGIEIDVPGVSYHAKANRWLVRIHRKHVGTFRDVNEAIAVARAAWAAESQRP